MTHPQDAVATNSGAMRRIVVDGIESTQRCADPNPNPETDTGPHLLVYRDQVTADDQAWPMQLYPKPGDEEPLRSIVYSCQPLPTPETVYRLGLDPADDLLERVIVAVTRDGLPVLSSRSYLPATWPAPTRGAAPRSANSPPPASRPARRHPHPRPHGHPRRHRRAGHRRRRRDEH